MSKSRQAQLLSLIEEGNEEAKADLFKEFPGLYNKMFGFDPQDEDPTIEIDQSFETGGVAKGAGKGKRFIARGCGAVMSDRRKKNFIYLGVNYAKKENICHET